MKGFIALIIAFSFSSAFAFNEVECDNGRLRFEVRSFPSGSIQKEAFITMNLGEGPSGTWKLYVNRYLNMGRVNYVSQSIDVDVNIWPDQIPRWGRTYPGYIRHTDAWQEQAYCRFPNARP